MMRMGLTLASLLYRVGVGWRNRQFDRERREIKRCAVPVISVGNLTTGGTGKTPVVCYIAKWFRAKEIRVAIVSRGYRSGDSGINDEAEELYQRLPDVPHVQQVDRVEAARIAVEELDAQVILMDDGFQHRRLARDIDLVLIDATCPFGFGHLLPRGLLREPLKSLKRADFVIVTRCDQVDQEQLLSIESAISDHQPNVPVVRSTHRPTELIDAAGNVSRIEDLKDVPTLVLCGIGNPEAFRATVETIGARVIGARTFPDHAAFDREVMSEITGWVKSNPDACHVVCTHKDLVKIRADQIGGIRLSAILINLEIERASLLNETLQLVADTVSDS